MKKHVSRVELAEEKLVPFEKSLRKTFFKNTSTLVYPGHRPISAIYVHSGRVILFKKRKILEIIGAGNLIMPHEFLAGDLLKFEIVVAGSSLISFVGMDTLPLLVQDTSLKEKFA